MTLRVKSDKEYAALLLSLTQQTEKQEAADYISTVSKVRLPDQSNQSCVPSTVTPDSCLCLWVSPGRRWSVRLRRWVEWWGVTLTTWTLVLCTASPRWSETSSKWRRATRVSISSWRATTTRSAGKIKTCANLTVLLSQWPCLFFFQVTRSELDKLKATYRQLSREANNAKEKYREALAKGSCCSFTPQKTVTLRCFCSLLLLPFPTSSSNHRKGGRASPRALRQSDGKAPQPS